MSYTMLIHVVSFQLICCRIFIWELFPEWIFPLLTGFSIFCLANPASTDFTHMFGGSNFNEGLGFLSLCFDWRYISAIWNPFVTPLRAQVLTQQPPFLNDTSGLHVS